MRTIVVMRHAKAEQAGPTDFDRPLADRGHQDAEAAGAWLAEQGFEPDHALVSAALRTGETWAGVAAGAGWELDPDLDRGLYAADTDTALDLLRRSATTYAGCWSSATTPRWRRSPTCSTTARRTRS